MEVLIPYLISNLLLAQFSHTSTLNIFNSQLDILQFCALQRLDLMLFLVAGGSFNSGHERKYIFFCLSSAELPAVLVMNAILFN